MTEAWAPANVSDRTTPDVASTLDDLHGVRRTRRFLAAPQIGAFNDVASSAARRPPERARMNLVAQRRYIYGAPEIISEA
jgi:hypothetical protein